ncbi:MAG TPA: response regulator [Ferruginibacter sp.]|nr:response regulator [Ferruginibacter sp.]
MKGKLKILILEDNPTDAEIVQRVLKKEKIHFESTVVMTSDAFLKALDEFKPDLILSDNSMPQFTATEALEIINERGTRIPFILVTGTVSEEFAATVIKLGADDYILKDRLIRLPSAIEAALRKKEDENEKLITAQRLVQSEVRFRTVVARISDAFIALDKNWCYTFANDRAGRLVQREPDYLIGKNVWEEFPESVGSVTYRDFHKAMNEQRYICNEDYYGPLDLWFENHIYPSPDGLSVFIRDITEKKKSEEAIRKMELEILNQKIQEQKKITRAIMNAQEKQRNHIGQELHDNVNQILAGTKLYLSMAGKKDDKLKDLIKYPMELIDNSISEIRILSSRYVTPLKDINLKEMVEKLLHNLDKSADIKTQFVYDVGDERAGDDLKLNIYRIIQEQINNVIRHASAKNVNVSIEADANDIHVTFTDDGVGFDPDKKRKGIGVSNMLNRVESFNGEVEIKTSKGNGCAIAIKIPYK